MHVVIIGAGASGLVSAIVSARNNNKVTILEKNDICGKKILATGNGRCNYFNSDFNINHYRSNNIAVLNDIINKKNKEKVLEFFDSIGIIPKIKNNCYYPYSNKAITIHNSLLNEIKKLNIEIKNNCDIKDINYNDKFIITTSKEKITCDKLIIATGSLAYTKDKTNFGYEILKKFNHTIIKPLPALTKLIGNEKYFKKWNGIRSDVSLKLLENDQEIASSNGEIMLTNYGLSGICIFDLSGRVSRGLYNNYKEDIVIDFMPYINNFIPYINKRNNELKDRNLLELFEGMINYKLVDILLKEENINCYLKWNELNIKEKEIIEKTFKQFEVNIKDTKSYLESQVCSGGIPLFEININTMESLKQKNLYIIGELLDVDGDCGGFNLGFAWLSGILSGSDISD